MNIYKELLTNDRLKYAQAAVRAAEQAKFEIKAPKAEPAIQTAALVSAQPAEKVQDSLVSQIWVAMKSKFGFLKSNISLQKLFPGHFRAMDPTLIDF